jgi:hypothetical protein
MTRLLAALAALALLVPLACGKYGPPQRPTRIAAPTGTAEPPPQAAPSDQQSSEKAGGAARGEPKASGAQP